MACHRIGWDGRGLWDWVFLCCNADIKTRPQNGSGSRTYARVTQCSWMSARIKIMPRSQNTSKFPHWNVWQVIKQMRRTNDARNINNSMEWISLNINPFDSLQLHNRLGVRPPATQDDADQGHVTLTLANYVWWNPIELAQCRIEFEERPSWSNVIPDLDTNNLNWNLKP